MLVQLQPRNASDALVDDAPVLKWRAALYQAPLAQPLGTGKGTVSTRSGAYLVCHGGGLTGVGEAAPLPAWGTENMATLEAALVPLLRPEGVLASLNDLPRLPALYAAAELAWLDWQAKRENMSLSAFLAHGPGVVQPAHALPTHLPCAALLGAGSRDEVLIAARQAVAQGHQTFKLKLASPSDVAIVLAVREALGPEVALRLDANGSWDFETALAALTRLAPAAPAFVEQPITPCKDKTWAELVARSPVPIAADEALAGGLSAIPDLLAAGVRHFVLKPMALGGLLAMRRLIVRLHEVGAFAILSSTLDRGVGSAGVLHLAASLPQPEPVGLGTVGLFADGGAVAGLEPQQGNLKIPQEPGLGVVATEPTLRALLAEFSQPAPPAFSFDRLSVIDADGVYWSAEALQTAVREQAQRLATWGLRRQAVLALWGPNTIAWLVAALAAWRLGAVVLPVSMRAADAEVANLLTRVRPALLLGASEWVQRAAHLNLETAQDSPSAPVPALPYDALARLPLAPVEWVTLGSPENPVTHDAPDAAIVPTSGTSGAPKLTRLTAAGLAATASATAQVLDLREGDIYWLPMPLTHVGGLGAVWRCAQAGATLLLAQPLAADVPALLRHHQVTHASLVPTQLTDILAAFDAAAPAKLAETGPQPPIPAAFEESSALPLLARTKAVARRDGPWPLSLRAVMVGGAALPANLVARCSMAFATFGLTEGGGTVSLSRASKAEGSSGLPLPGWEVAIREDEVWVRGPGTMAGYMHDATATNQVLKSDGWLNTGDLGYLDDAGALHILARRSDLIVSGGENVYPAEVEAALMQRLPLAEVAIVGAPHPRWGAVPAAFVVWKDGQGPQALDVVREALAPVLSRFKHPHHLFTLAALPRLANGKIDRARLNTEAASLLEVSEWPPGNEPSVPPRSPAERAHA